MLKWVLAAVGIVVAMIAIFIGVVLFLFNREGPDMSNLTELHSAEVLDLTDLGSSYRVVYEYTYQGETFYGRKTINGNSLHRGSTFGICLDPSDPAKHAHTHTDCGPGGPLDPKEGLKEKPEL
ncbi:hypothetical protein FB381_4450 [Nocardioides albertanoniae]|uniref:Uncharacterized protein n=1 Tax=Nocardioides albertanoniae TaxID=1175486 RepID=A0A543AD59_9ACTN|nr:hypothetical protein [Nocardioides albertanoniae]TQL70515.1 hypothetical protein FB381_4450 [Nocardioides albertanoniae]